jgi:inositol oxygenase
VQLSIQVLKQHEKYTKLQNGRMSVWEACELLNELVDESDPDLDEPQIEHLLQTAEAIRRCVPMSLISFSQSIG